MIQHGMTISWGVVVVDARRNIANTRCERVGNKVNSITSRGGSQQDHDSYAKIASACPK